MQRLFICASSVVYLFALLWRFHCELIPFLWVAANLRRFVSSLYRVFLYGISVVTSYLLHLCTKFLFISSSGWMVIHNHAAWKKSKVYNLLVELLQRLGYLEGKKRR